MRRLKDFGCDNRGAVSILFGLSLLILLAGAGLSFDASNLFKARAALQASADAAALAVSADTITNNTQVADVAKEYLGANAPPSSLVQIATITAGYSSATKTATVSLTGTTQTSFMALLGVTTVDVSVSSEAKRGEVGPLDLVLALDLTTSMREEIDGVQKVDTLETAAKSLIDTVMKTTHARVGIVPFANYVQVGTGVRDSDWISVDKDISVPWCAWSGGGNFGTCQYENYPCTMDGGSFICQRAVNCKWEKNTNTPEYKCGVNHYKWGGCVLSRMSGDEYLATITSPKNPKYTGRVTTSANDRPPNADAGGCSGAPITELTNVKSTVTAAFNSFGFTYPVGETFIPDGLLWSWNMLTKEAPLTSARSQTEMEALGGKKALVLMTDGFNTRYAGKDGWHYPTGSNASLRAKADTATSELCTKIKADGIIVYTVAFGVTDTGIKTILQSCASSPSKFFDAADANGLKASFTSIGAELQRVRLTR